jgi:exosome complex RNA-binding protein Rrp42 (RNase PH superfamily)
MLTFGILNGEKLDDKYDNDYILFDPTRNEEEVISGRITITMNVYKDVCAIHQPGGATIKPSLVSE